MKKLVSTLVLFSFLQLNLFGQLQKALEAMSQNKYEDATSILLSTIENEEDVIDSYMTLVLLNSIIGNDVENLDLVIKALEKMDNPSPYLYAIWFNYGVTNGTGGIKSEKRLNFLKMLIASSKINETLKGAARYTIGHHHIASTDFSKGFQEWSKIEAVTDWQFVGVFDNTSGSGFDKKYRPIAEPQPTSNFKNKYNANVDWFVPKYKDNDSWVISNNYLPTSEGITYAQTFLNNPEERTVIFSVGFEGSIKVWLNDHLVLAEEQERRTEMDYIQRKLILPKGNNRVLLQLGQTNESDYSNFLFRIFDEQQNLISNYTVSSNATDYNSGPIDLAEEIPHFAETFFKEKISANPKNIINYILLSKCYYRAGKNNDAISILEKAQKFSPENLLVNIELLLNYVEVEDRTILLKQLEHIRNINGELVLLDFYDYKIAQSNDDIPEMEKLLAKMAQKVGTKDIEYLKNKIDLLIKKQEFQELERVIEQAYAEYPDYSNIAAINYHLQKGKYNGNGAPYSLLEKFLKKRYSYKILSLLVDEYLEGNKKSKALKHLLKQHNIFNAERDIIQKLMVYYYKGQDFENSLSYANKSISIAPYMSDSYMSRAFIYLALNNVPAAIKDLKKVIELNPNSFDAREKLRDLEGKNSFTTLLKNHSASKTIKEALQKTEDTDESYKFIFLDKSHVQFSEGAAVEFLSVGIKVLNESGIEAWKEASIGTNYNRESLILEKAVVHKKSGAKIEGEKNYNQIVFPNVEVGDVIQIEYRKNKYTGGKLAKELSIEDAISDFVPIENFRYRVFIPKNYEVFENHTNLPKEATKTTFEDFQVFEWNISKIEPIKDENYMPKVSEVGVGINLSTINSWKVISNWYKDIAIPMAKEDYNLNAVYNEIFNGKNFTTEWEKHEAIYNYLCDNIKYSSVSFRQSNFVPQKPMVTLSTNLGDCKDLSTLYHTLARKAGLKTNLVLVSTKDNGESTMFVPSTYFNHCIIRLEIDGQAYFQELTDNQLPFGSTPNSIQNAQGLIIPNNDKEKFGDSLIRIPERNKVINSVKRTVEVNLDGTNCDIKTKVTATGAKASAYRHSFIDLTEEEKKEKINDYLNDFIDYDFIVNNYEFDNMNNREKTASIKIDATITNFTKSIGSMNTFIVPFFEEIVSLNNFPFEDREHPICYWKYENVQEYVTEVFINLKEGTSFVEIPNEFKLTNEFIDYHITVEKINNTQMKVTRTVHPKIKTFDAKIYLKMRQNIADILKVEDMYIAYK